MTRERERDPWTYDDFACGSAIDTVEVTIDARRVGLWNRIYGKASGEVGEGDPLPEGLVVAAMMEGFIKAIHPRPPGNIHAGQTLSFTGTRVNPGAHLSVAFTCEAKDIRRERRWVTFGVCVREGEQLIAEGEINSIWAK